MKQMEERTTAQDASAKEQSQKLGNRLSEVALKLGAVMLAMEEQRFHKAHGIKKNPIQ